MSLPEDVTITGDEWKDYPPHHDWRVNATVTLLHNACEDLKHYEDRISSLIKYAKWIIRWMPAATSQVQKENDRRRLEECRHDIKQYSEWKAKAISRILELLPGLNHTYLHNPPHEEDDA
tara:strand:+ start:137 stop:496 length:360 start_codon:yes stop_codon:yes gene_type:complete